uniref:Uncharacterized protein n=1 Tax=Plectus sambesii TaxID=2011161 RepID=A0A914VM90_9BILA
MFLYKENDNVERMWPREQHYAVLVFASIAASFKWTYTKTLGDPTLRRTGVMGEWEGVEDETPARCTRGQRDAAPGGGVGQSPGVNYDPIIAARAVVFHTASAKHGHTRDARLTYLGSPDPLPALIRLFRWADERNPRLCTTYALGQAIDMLRSSRALSFGPPSSPPSRQPNISRRRFWYSATPTQAKRQTALVPDDDSTADAAVPPGRSTRPPLSALA